MSKCIPELRIDGINRSGCITEKAYTFCRGPASEWPSSKMGAWAPLPLEKVGLFYRVPHEWWIFPLKLRWQVKEGRKKKRLTSERSLGLNSVRDGQGKQRRNAAQDGSSVRFLFITVRLFNSCHTCHSHKPSWHEIWIRWADHIISYETDLRGTLEDAVLVPPPCRITERSSEEMKRRGNRQHAPVHHSRGNRDSLSAVFGGHHLRSLTCWKSSSLGEKRKSNGQMKNTNWYNYAISFWKLKTEKKIKMIKIKI